jgi:hypothetical protein
MYQPKRARGIDADALDKLIPIRIARGTVRPELKGERTRTRKVCLSRLPPAVRSN